MFSVFLLPSVGLTRVGPPSLEHLENDVAVSEIVLVTVQGIVCIWWWEVLSV